MRSGATIHVNLDLTTKITTSTNAWLMGWGTDDNVNPHGLRLIASDQFQNTGSTFFQNCESWPTCSGATATGVTCSPNGIGYYGDTVVLTQRWGSAGSYSGGAGGIGDSGGPVFIHAGTGAGDVNDANLIAAPGGPYFQIATNSGVSADDGDGVAIDAGTFRTMSHAPTFTADTGGWIDKVLTKWATDFDDDGVNDTQDNCPNLANHPQSNANVIAEQSLADTPAGDACDVNATTRGLPGVEWNSPVSAPCTHVVINGNQTFTLSSSGSCPVVYNTGITMRGNIGNAFGNAPIATGQSVPSYCDCDKANTSLAGLCASSPYFCAVAQDQLDPYVTGFLPSGWRTITQHDTSDHAYDFTSRVALSHQDPSDAQILLGRWDATKDQTSYWNYMLDMAAWSMSGNTLTGQVWTHLPPSKFVPHQFSTETQPATNRPSHYIDFQATQHPGYTFSVAPPLVNLYIPFWVKITAATPDVPFLLVGTETSGAVDVIAETQSGVQWMNGRFDSSARTALSTVASHVSDIIVADEFAANDGAVSSAAVRAITTWANDTSIRAGFTQNYQLLSATTTANANTSFAPSAGAYSASTGKLYALKNSGGWKLFAFDVAAALAGSPTNTNVAITGPAPATPVAMAYNASDGNLYVIDSLTVTGGTGLRLLRMSTAGVATELWRTTGVSTVPSAYLSVSVSGELVLGLVQSGSKLYETILLDRIGRPWWSVSGSGLFLGRPVANENGVSIGRTDSVGRSAIASAFYARTSMTNGLCAATWLKAHVDYSAYTPLGYPAGDCP